MSFTSSVDVVGISYWTYMAAVMAESLSKVIRAKRIPDGLLPKGAYGDALEFFRLALLSDGGDAAANDPGAALHAYMIAAEAVSEATKIQERDDVANFLGLFAEFVKKLEKPRALDADELKLARILRDFFLQIKEDGESEAYERRFQRGAPPVRLRTSVIHD